MKTRAILFFVAAVLLAGFSTVRAQVPQLINFQGRVAVSGVNFDGTGQFRFALVNGDATTTFWSNDGTSAGGSQPAAAVSLTVNKGLYSVLLGDTSLASMTALPAMVFTNADVRLRVWFDDGVNGSQLLAPDQRIAAVGYALMAAGVPDGSITSAKIAPGAVGGAQLASGAVQSGNIATGAVGASQIAAGAVGGSQLAAGAVQAANLAPGAVDFASLAKPPQSGTVGGATLPLGFGDAEFSVTYPSLFATAPVVTVSLSTSTSAFPREAGVQVLSGNRIGFTGRLTGLSAQESEVIPGENAGTHSAVALVDGNPAIAYSYDGASGALYFVRANDAEGTTWGTPVSVDSLTGVNARSLSLAVVNGNPAISYLGTGGLRYIRATNTTGTAWGASVQPGGGVPGEFGSMVVVNGNPAIAFYNNSSRDLQYIRATDASGTAWGGVQTLESSNDTGKFPSLAIVSGNPAISYYVVTGANLRYIRANDTSGTVWGSAVNVDGAGDVGQFTSLGDAGGSPVISYYHFSNGQLRFVRANNSTGSSWGTPVVLDNVSVSRVLYISMATVGGNPAISYGDPFMGTLSYIRAQDFRAAEWFAPVRLSSFPTGGESASLVATASGRPVVAWKGANQSLRAMRATTPASFSINWIALPQ